MGICDTFSFSSKKYCQHLQETVTLDDKKVSVVSDIDLLRKLHTKTMLRTSSVSNVATGLAIAPLTLGVSLVGSAYSARQHRVLQRQQKLVVEELVRRGYSTTYIEQHVRRTRDVVAGALLGGTIAACRFIMPAIGEAAGPAIEAIAHETTQAALVTIPHLLDDGAVHCVVQGAVEGVHATLINEVHHMFGDPTPHVLPNLCLSEPLAFPFVEGESLGAEATMQAEAFAAQQTISYSAQAALSQATSNVEKKEEKEKIE